MKPSVVAIIASFAASVYAHGGIYSYEIDGVTYPGYKWQEPADNQKNLIQRRWYFWPVEDLLSPNMTCNFNGAAVPSAYHAPVRAGGSIKAQWANNFTWSDRSLDFYCDPASLNQTCPPGAVCDFRCLYNHWYHSHGPLTAYMADCAGDCSLVEPASLKWFKIAEEGLRPGSVLGAAAGWYQSDLGAPAVPGWTVTIPKTLKSGNYLIRHEIIMIELMPPQSYPECAQITVTEGGDATPGEEYLVKFPGAYSMSDPGLAISGRVYYPEGQTLKNYTVPGPKVWRGPG